MRAFFKSYASILGINARNIDYIFAYNRRRYYPQVDDKLLTKTFAEKAGIHFPKTYAVIEYQQQVKHLLKHIGSVDDFVIKPVHGSGGNGILVITGRDGKGFKKASGEVLSYGDLMYHVSNILSGMYSLGGIYDKALIEYRVKSCSSLSRYAYHGVPDIRIILFKEKPVMAMLRLPTKASDGKANLHAGGVGVGIDINLGKGLCGIQYDELITHHPDTNQSLTDILIKNWAEVITLAQNLSKEISLKYIGVDIVIDKKIGPLLLEVNARPGLAIQIANQTGLKNLLEKMA